MKTYVILNAQAAQLRLDGVEDARLVPLNYILDRFQSTLRPVDIVQNEREFVVETPESGQDFYQLVFALFRLPEIMHVSATSFNQRDLANIDERDVLALDLKQAAFEKCESPDSTILAANSHTESLLRKIKTGKTLDA